ncbi:MFS transporter [Streptomyces achromogenes]|uniref:MFS transporter n=1 Tax=Streptomyces achromogenes TaxID=67255 RepID=UPI003684A294
MSASAISPPAALSGPQRTTAVGVFGAVNVVVRGALAVLGVAGTQDLGWSAGATAALVAYASLTMRFGRVVIAPLLRRGSVRGVSSVAMTAVGAGLLLLAQARSVPLAWLAVTLLGTGYGAVVLTIKVALVSDRPQQVFRGLGLLATVLNIGAAVGPLLSGALQAALGGRPDFLVLGCLALGGAALSAALLPGERGGAEVRLDAASLRLMLKGRILYLVALLAVAFCFYAQLYATFPLLVHARTGSDGLLGVVFAVNAVVVIALQLPVTNLAARNAWVRSHGSAAGLALFALAFLILACTSSVWGVFGATVVASCAECLLLPLIEAELSERLGTHALTAAFTLSAIGMGLGETAGSYAGVQFTLAGPDEAGAFLTVLAVGSAAVAVCAAVAAGRPTTRTKAD